MPLFHFLLESFLILSKTIFEKLGKRISQVVMIHSRQKCIHSRQKFIKCLLNTFYVLGIFLFAKGITLNRKMKYLNCGAYIHYGDQRMVRYFLVRIGYACDF